MKGKDGLRTYKGYNMKNKLCAIVMILCFGVQGYTQKNDTTVIHFKSIMGLKNSCGFFKHTENMIRRSNGDTILFEPFEEIPFSIANDMGLLDSSQLYFYNNFVFEKWAYFQLDNISYGLKFTTHHRSDFFEAFINDGSLLLFGREFKTVVVFKRGNDGGYLETLYFDQVYGWIMSSRCMNEYELRSDFELKNGKLRRIKKNERKME
jgi:hypothetical protein